jgi:hypothetical protein
VTETQTQTEPDVEANDVDPTTDTRITSDLLRALGACDEYPRRFERIFPVTEHPDGVEPTVEVCVANVNEFDWYWAASAMLSRDAHARYTREVDSRTTTQRWDQERNDVRQARHEARLDWQKRFDQPNDYPDWNAPDEAKVAYNTIEDQFTERFANIDRRAVEERAVQFATLYADPANHNDNLRVARLKADGIAEDRDNRLLRDAQRRVSTAERGITDAEASIVAYQQSIEQYRTQLPDYRTRLAEVEAEVQGRRRTRDRRRNVVAVAEARRAVEESQRRLADAESRLIEAQRLASGSGDA